MRSHNSTASKLSVACCITKKKSLPSVQEPAFYDTSQRVNRSLAMPTVLSVYLTSFPSAPGRGRPFPVIVPDRKMHLLYFPHDQQLDFLQGSTEMSAFLNCSASATWNSIPCSFSYLICLFPLQPLLQFVLSFSLPLICLWLGFTREMSDSWVQGCACVLNHFIRVQLGVTPWTVVHQASLFMGFSRQEYWNGLPWLPSGDLPDPGIQPWVSQSPVLAGSFFTTGATGLLFLQYIYEDFMLNELRHLK